MPVNLDWLSQIAQPVKPVDPLQMQMQAINLQNAQLQQQEALQRQADIQAQNRAWSSFVDDKGNVNITADTLKQSGVEGHLIPGLLDIAAKYNKSRLEASEIQARIDDLQDKHAKEQKTSAGLLAYGAKQSGYKPDVMNTALLAAQNARILTPQEAQQFQTLPIYDQIDAIDRIVSESPEAQELIKKRFEIEKTQAEMPGIKAKGEQEAQIAAGMVGGLTPAQQKEAEARTQSLTETARHNLVTEQLAKNKFAQTLKQQNVDIDTVPQRTNPFNDNQVYIDLGVVTPTQKMKVLQAAAATGVVPLTPQQATLMGNIEAAENQIKRLRTAFDKLSKTAKPEGLQSFEDFLKNVAPERVGEAATNYIAKVGQNSEYGLALNDVTQAQLAAITAVKALAGNSRLFRTEFDKAAQVMPGSLTDTPANRLRQLSGIEDMLRQEAAGLMNVRQPTTAPSPFSKIGGLEVSHKPATPPTTGQKKNLVVIGKDSKGNWIFKEEGGE